VLLTGFAYGAVDELLQPFVHRDAELLDWVADATGVWAAVVILWLLQRWLIPRHSDADFRRTPTSAPAPAADAQP
jgi:VanZ family protein